MKRWAGAYQSGETAEKGEPKVAEGERKVLVEEVAEELGHPQVGPPPVDQQQPLQITKLGNAVIGRQHRLQFKFNFNSLDCY